MDIRLACETLARARNGKRPPLTEAEKAEILGGTMCEAEGRSKVVSIKRILGAVVLIGLLLYLWVKPADSEPPCPVSAPTPHLHIDDTTGGFNPSASCPEGWNVKITPEASKAYNEIRTHAAAVNMLADAPCVRK